MKGQSIRINLSVKAIHAVERWLAVVNGLASAVTVRTSEQSLSLSLNTSHCEHQLQLSRQDFSVCLRLLSPIQFSIGFTDFYRSIASHFRTGAPLKRLQIQISIGSGSVRKVDVLGVKQKEVPNSKGLFDEAGKECKAERDELVRIRFRFAVYVRAISHCLLGTGSDWILFLFQPGLFRFLSYGPDEWFQGVYVADPRLRERPRDLFYKTGTLACRVRSGHKGWFYDARGLARFLMLAEDRSLTELYWDSQGRLFGMISLGGNPMYSENDAGWRHRYLVSLRPQNGLKAGLRKLAGRSFDIVSGATIGEEGFCSDSSWDIEPFVPLLRIRMSLKGTVGGPGFGFPESGCLPDLEVAYERDRRAFRSRHAKRARRGQS
jgi:hypothetical protein